MPTAQHSNVDQASVVCSFKNYAFRRIASSFRDESAQFFAADASSKIFNARGRVRHLLRQRSLTIFRPSQSRGRTHQIAHTLPHLQILLIKNVGSEADRSFKVEFVRGLYILLIRAEYASHVAPGAELCSSLHLGRS